MEAVRSWAVCVVVCVVAAAVVQLFFPNLEKEKSVRIVVSVFLITAVLSPFLSGNGIRLDLPELASGSAQAELERISGKIDQTVATQMQQRLKQTVQGLLDDLGVPVRDIQVNTDILADGYIQIDEIILTPQGEGDWEKVSSYIEEKTGCPVRVQTR